MSTYFVGLNKTFSELNNEWLPRDKVDAVVVADPELEWVALNDATASEVPPPNQTISWLGTPRFFYKSIFLSCEDPDPATVRKLLQIAAALKGYLYNDSGERLELRKGMFGGERVVRISE